MIADVPGRGGGISAGSLALAVCLAVQPTAADAHELERTVVRLDVMADGTFVLDVANDPDWLLLRLEPFLTQGDVAPPRPAGSRAPAERDDRLRELAPVFIDRIVLFVDGAEVRPDRIEFRAPEGPGAAIDHASLATYRLYGRFGAEARRLRWYYGLVVDPYPLTIRHHDGSSVTEWVAGDAWSTTLSLGPFTRPSRWHVAGEYLRLGYVHILPRGLDHVLFVLGLFLLSQRWRPLLAQVTCFTLAHSITLGLAMSGVVSLPSRIVEPLIAASIVCVAAENVLTDRLHPWRLALVCGFGLIHGLGFAGVLTGLGMPPSEFLLALLSFNVGVELGQLTVIGLAYVAVWRFRDRAWYRQRVVMPASFAIAVVSVYWVVVRLTA